MAKKRMLSTQITDSDEFISMKAQSQALYLHLCLAADDDGFTNQIQMAMYKAHANKSHLQELIDKKYILKFDGNIVCIKHWLILNAIRKDRHIPSVYQKELGQLSVKSNGAYTMTDKCRSSDRQMTDKCQADDGIDQIRLDKYRLDKYREEDIYKRLMESGINVEILDSAMGYLPSNYHTESNLLKVVGVLQNKEIADKKAYINTMKRNNDLEKRYDS